MESPARQPANGAAEFVDKLNREYNLGIHIAPLGLSPRKRKEAITTEDELVAERIHGLVRRLGFQPPDVLLGVDEQFNRGARRVCSRWVRKPRAALNLVPVTDAPPRASTAEERRQLRECLLEILLDHSPKPGTRPLGYRKRPSDERLLAPEVYTSFPNTSPPKRARSAIDKVPVATSPEPRNGNPVPANRSFNLNGGPAAAHPPPHRSFSGAPTADHPVGFQAIAHRPLRQTSSEPMAPTRSASLHESARSSRRGAPSAASHSSGLNGQATRDQVSANTSITTRHSAIFSFPPPDDSDGSQSTIPNDDREEYNDAHVEFDMAFDKPTTPTGLGGFQAAAVGGSDSSLDLITSSEEADLIALDSTTPNQGRVGAASAPRMQTGLYDGDEFSEATPRRLFQDVARVNGDAKSTIRQRVRNLSVSSTAATWSTTCDADVDDRRPILGGPVADEPPLFSTPLSLEDRLRNSWREKPIFFFLTLPLCKNQLRPERLDADLPTKPWPCV